MLLSTSLHPWAAYARPVFGKHGVIASASDLASQAGIKTLQAGGNAADAAVTTYFVLAVTRPYYASLGGGGFMLTRFADHVDALDFRERAPHKSKSDMFVKANKKSSTDGGLASGTPGNVRGFFELHKKFGKLPWSKDLEPAIEMAKSGFMVTEEFARLTKENFLRFNESGRNIFGVDKKPVEVGDTLRQPALATALEMIAKDGASAFYGKLMADDIATTIKNTGGIIDTFDLERYAARWAQPLKANVFGAEIYSMPPPSSGGTLLLEELKLSEKLDLKNERPESQSELHIMAEIMNRAFFDRQYLADAKFGGVAPETLFSDERVAKWAATINKKKKTSFDPKKFEIKGARRTALSGQVLYVTHESTTHFVIADKDGNVVSATTTINGDYGSGVVTDKFGIVMNNEMDDFTTRPGEPNLFGLTQGAANAVAADKTPLSSMTPTIIDRDGKFFMALGAPGGPKIINAVYQTAYHALTTSFNVDELVQLPRVHNQFKPDKLFTDRLLSPDTKAALEKKGHILSEAPVARVYCVRLNDTGLYEGAADGRGEGGVSGY